MKDMARDAIACALCVISAATLAPVSAQLRQDGAADWFALLFLIAAGVAILAGAFFAWRLARKA